MHEAEAEAPVKVANRTVCQPGCKHMCDLTKLISALTFLSNTWLRHKCEGLFQSYRT